MQDAAFPTVMTLTDQNDIELFEMDHMPKVVLLQGTASDRAAFAEVAKSFKTEYSFLIIEDGSVKSLRQ